MLAKFWPNFVRKSEVQKMNTVRITLTETPRGEFYTPMLSEKFFLRRSREASRATKHVFPFFSMPRREAPRDTDSFSIFRCQSKYRCRREAPRDDPKAPKIGREAPRDDSKDA